VDELTTSAEGDIEIAAPPERVFEVLTEERYFFALRPNAVEHRNIVPTPDGGHSCVTVYRMGRKKTEQVCRTIEFVPPRRLVEESATADAMARQSITCEAAGAGTKVSVVVEMSLAPTSTAPPGMARWSMQRQLRRFLRTLRLVAEARRD
jgi:uncharacterized protein YndB with AHSA1/START domain